MNPVNENFRTDRPLFPRSGERGNVLFIILLTIMLLGMLTYAISQSSTQQSNAIPQQTVDNQINQMIAYASALGGALQQMALNGENPNTLYSTVDVLPPASDPNYDTPPNSLKIYHPLGGGITYQSQSAPTDAIATNFNINPASIITGIGCTSGAGCIVTSVPTAGHIIFTAELSDAAYCARTNNILHGSSTVPTMDATAFTGLFTNGSTVTINAGNCASCVNVARLCVTDGSGHYGFYADLFPPRYGNAQ
jgi:hypothetical protein